MKWMKLTLYLAGIYNILWGTIVILFPTALFTLVGLAQPLYPELFQAIGMMVAVFGVAYLFAASNPVHHLPVILAGLLGRILGVIGFTYAAYKGSFPWLAGITILTNDVIWIIPFSLILWKILAFKKMDSRP